MSVVTFDSEYNGRRVRAEINVIQAEGLEAIARTLLIIEADGEPPPAKAALRDMARYSLKRGVYPDCIGSVREGWIEIDGEHYDATDLPFSVFEQIPFPLLFAWEQETYRCNPNWLPEAQESQKKARGSYSNASRSSMTRKRTKTASPNSSI
jgi:hypothetical protein